MSLGSFAWQQNLVIALAVAALAGGCHKEEPAKTSTGHGAEPAPSLAPVGQDQAAPAPVDQPVAGQDSPRGGQSTTDGGQGALPPGHPPIEGRPPDKGKFRTPAVSPWAAEIDGTLTAAGIKFDLPPGWVGQKPASRLRLAQYELPGEVGPAELAVFCFGVGQGGSVQANIDRWLAQFKDPHHPGARPTGDVMAIEQDGLKLSVVKAAGTYSAGSMGPMGSPEPPKPDYGLYGLIIEGGQQGNVFAKITGPAGTIAAQTEAIASFARSARLGE